MSFVESEARSAKDAKSSAVDKESDEALTESTRDDHETRMTYDAQSKIPWFVVAAWGCALVGLGIYFFTYYLADLRAWGGS